MTGATTGTPAQVAEAADLEAVDQLLAQLFRPAGVRLGALTTADVDPSLATALERSVVAAGLDPARRLARLQPRVGEHDARPADVADFLRRYGHEYAVALFEADRWGDDDRRLVGAAGLRQGCSVVWAGAHRRSPHPS